MTNQLQSLFEKRIVSVEESLPEGVSRAFDENDYEITLMPHTAGTDGFYIALLMRV